MNWIQDQVERFQVWLAGLTETQRRLLLASTLLVSAVIIGFIIYWVFFRSLLPGPEANENVNAVNLNALPDIILNANRNANENVNAITTLPDIDTVALGGNTLSQVIYSGDAQDVTLSGDGSTIQYYDPVTGQFYTIDANGNITLLDDQVFKGVEDVTWANDADKAVLEFEDGFKVLYDFTQDKQYTLNRDMEEFDFSPTDTQISFKFTPENEDDRWLGVANLDGSGARGIEPLGDNEDLVNAQWSPAGHSIGVLNEYVDGNHKQVVPLGFNDENFKGFVVSGRGFDYRWTVDGKRMIYSTYSSDSNYNSVLHIVDAYGDDIGANNSSLELATSVDKCTFSASGDHLYCAVPVDPPTGGGIAPGVLNDVQHDIYEINLVTGLKEKIATPADNTAGTDLSGPSDLVVSEDENVLYYREATTGKIRRILLE
ncbi:MAG: hypothetical protein ACD_41C00344G0002 [uncultured bacterium]|nr:MAG: hypothetical protein ACD_41C00344G0002 [uncultured bacterium]